MILRDGIPIYEQIKEDIIVKIKNSTYQPGQRLPSERDLASAYNVSRVTIRQAISSLVLDNIVEKRVGSGAFVKRVAISQNMSHMRGIVSELEQLDIDLSIKLIECSRISYSDKDSDIWKYLSLSQDEYVYRIHRVLSTNTGPLLLDTNYLPDEIGAKYEQFDLSKNVIFAALDTLGYHVHHAKQTICAKAATKHQSKLLRIPVRSPLLEVCRLSFDQKHVPLLYTEADFVGDLYKYTIDLDRI